MRPAVAFGRPLNRLGKLRPNECREAGALRHAPTKAPIETRRYG